MDKLFPAFNEQEVHVTRGLSPAELSTMSQALRRIVVGLEDASADDDPPATATASVRARARRARG